MFDLGKLLRDLRKMNGLTQAQAAKKLNVSTNTILRWENNYKKPSVERLMDLALFYKIPISRLLGVETEKSIVVGHLTPHQQELLYQLMLEFQQKHTGNPN